MIFQSNGTPRLRPPFWNRMPSAPMIVSST